MKTVLVVGAGNMGEALANSSFKNQPDVKLILLEVNKDRVKFLNNKGYEVYDDQNRLDLNLVDVVLLAVKPQHASPIIKGFACKLKKSTLWLSIMAGKSVDSISQIENVEKVVRLMPNLPTLVGGGTIGVYANGLVGQDEKNWLDKCLSVSNKVIWVEKEDGIDAVTSISGSGPAYVMYFMNAMFESALDKGFPKPEAMLLVNQTFRGSLDLLSENNLDYLDWISAIKSKGGTTEAALDCFNANKLNEIIKKGTSAAYQRAKELAT